MKAVSKLRPWKTSSKSSTSSDAGSGPTTEQSSSNSNSTSYTGSTSSPPSSAPVSDIDLAEQAAQEQLDRDVSRRKEAIERLYSASEAYWSYLGKKKPLPFNAQLPKGVKEAVEHEKATAAASGLAGEEEEELAEDDDATGTTKASSKKTLAGGTAMLKGLWSSGTNSILSKLSKEETVMPCEALGLSLLQASELLFPAADSSPSGHAQSLASLGTAHLSLAQLQSVFARDISNIYLARLVRSKVSIEAYQAARKKVETTRARLAAARAKSTALAEKGKRDASKKEGASAAEGLERKEREIEEELRNARAAHDDAVSDLETRIDLLRADEAHDAEAHNEFLNASVDYAAAVHETLLQVVSSVPASSAGGANTSARSSSALGLSSGRERSASASGQLGSTMLSSRSSSNSLAGTPRLKKTSLKQRPCFLRDSDPASAAFANDDDADAEGEEAGVSMKGARSNSNMSGKRRPRMSSIGNSVSSMSSTTLSTLGGTVRGTFMRAKSSDAVPQLGGLSTTAATDTKGSVSVSASPLVGGNARLPASYSDGKDLNSEQGQGTISKGSAWAKGLLRGSKDKKSGFVDLDNDEAGTNSLQFSEEQQWRTESMLRDVVSLGAGEEEHLADGRTQRRHTQPSTDDASHDESDVHSGEETDANHERMTRNERWASFGGGMDSLQSSSGEPAYLSGHGEHHPPTIGLLDTSAAYQHFSLHSPDASDGMGMGNSLFPNSASVKQTFTGLSSGSNPFAEGGMGNLSPAFGGGGFEAQRQISPQITGEDEQLLGAARRAEEDEARKGTVPGAGKSGSTLPPLPPAALPMKKVAPPIPSLPPRKDKGIRLPE